MKEIVVDCHWEEYVEPAMKTLRDRSIQEDSLLYVLPRELLEIITQYLDCVSAIRLACTCAKFYNLVNETAPWKRFVLQEIIDCHELLDLGLHFGVPLWRQKRPICAPWRQIAYGREFFKSITRWHYALAFESSIPMDEITSVCVAGQSVVCGTRRGGLVLWNPDESGSYIHPILHTNAEIDQIFVQLSPNCVDRCFHYRVIIHSIDTALTVYDLSGYTLVCGVSKMRDLKKILNRGDCLVEWDANWGNNADTFIEEKVVKRCVNFNNMHVPYGPFVAIDVFEHVFVSQSRGPLLLRTSPYSTLILAKELFQSKESLWIVSAYIWPGKISFSIAAGRLTIISVGEKCSGILWPNMYRCVSATLSTNLLAIGTDDGRVLLYTFKTPLQLLKLDPLNYQKSLSTGTADPVIYVGLRMQNNFHELPDVVAATRRSLFCFRAS